MTKVIEDKIDKIPIIGNLARGAKKVILPGLNGLSLYDLLEMYIFGIVRGTFTPRAGSIAFSFFMALFPFLLFVLNLIPFVWFIEDFQTRLLSYLESLLPPQTHELFERIFYDIANTPRTGLLSFVFVLSVFLMANGINAIFSGFEYSWHTKKNRSILGQYFVALGVAVIIAFFLLATVIITIYLTYIIEDLNALGIFSDKIKWAEIGRTAVFILLIFNSVSTLYYFGTKESKYARYFSVGSVFTTVLILLFTYLFAGYVQSFGGYNKLYGSIGALLILMIYVWLNSIILLLGFELNGTILRLKNKNAYNQKENHLT
ncbi:MAG TPA: YihY/virulence factor BrkB family protein [Flavobacteriaceae bacterium]|nr:YihY/virulence factor BrkB family protein [Flavobacteriaceae bacterium]